MRRKRVLFWTGALLLTGGLLFAAQVPFFYLRSHMRGQRLLGQAGNMLTDPVAATGQTSGQTKDTQTPDNLQSVQLASTWTLPAARPNTLIGGVSIPSIGVKAPLLEGTDDAELDVGAGHLVASVWPGAHGTSVIAAHNATWFRHLDELHPGDFVQVWTRQGMAAYKVTKSEIVRTGDPIADTAAPSLVLEACYPLDALYLTPYRYLVYAEWVRTDEVGTADRETWNADDIVYHAQVPAALIKEGITLSTNELPMGSLEFAGNPDHTYTESNAPLSASSTLVQMYLAWVHASSEWNSTYLHALWPSCTEASPISGIPSEDISYDGHFDVTLFVQGSVLQRVHAEDIMNVRGKRFKVSVDADVDGQYVMHLASVVLTPM